MATTAAVSTDTRASGRGRGRSADHAQARAPARQAPASGADVPGVGRAANQASTVSARKRARPVSAATLPRAGERKLKSADGLELLQERVRRRRALQDRRGARDLVDRLLDGFRSRAALQLGLGLDVMLVDDALADGAEDVVADLAHLVEAANQ